MSTPTEKPTQGTTPNFTQNVDKQNFSENTQLVERIEVEDSPFTILKWENKYYLCLGKYRLTEALNTEIEAREEVLNVSWFRILQVMHIVVKEEMQPQRHGIK